MRIKNFIFIAVLALSMTAKADEIKRPDSYNYQKGCEAATNGRFEEGMKYRRSLEYLKLAFEKGYHEIKHIEQDDDLEAIRKLPEYKALIEKYKH